MFDRTKAIMPTATCKARNLPSQIYSAIALCCGCVVIASVDTRLDDDIHNTPVLDAQLFL